MAPSGSRSTVAVTLLMKQTLYHQATTAVWALICTRFNILYYNCSQIFSNFLLDDQSCFINNRQYSSPYQSFTNINDFCECKIQCQQDTRCAAFDLSWQQNGGWTCNLVASQTTLKVFNWGNAGLKYCQTTGTLAPVVIKTPGNRKKIICGAGTPGAAWYEGQFFEQSPSQSLSLQIFIFFGFLSLPL